MAAALAVVVAIVGGAVLALLAGAARTVTAPDRYSASRGKVYDVTITQSHGAPRGTELDGLPATGRVDTASFVFGAVTPSGSTSATDALVFAGSQGPLGTRLIAGRLADPARPGEFAASRGFIHTTHARIGDRFSLQTLTQAQADQAGFDTLNPAGPRLDATLVGIIDGPSDLNDGYAVALFPPSLLGQGDVGISETIAVAALAPGATVATLRSQLDALPNGDVFSLDKAEWVSQDVRAAVNAQGEGLVIVALIVLVAAVVVLGQLLSRQLRLDDDERTALLALGFRRSQVVIEPVSRAAIAVVAGVAGAGVLAYAASDRFPLGFVRRVEPDPGRRFDVLAHGLGPVVIAAALLLSLAVSLILDGRPVRGRRAPGSTERVAAVAPSGQLSVAIRFAFSSPTRRARSAGAPLLALTVVLCVLAGALTFGANLVRLSGTPREWGINFDLGLGAGASQIAPEIQTRLAASPDVRAMTLYGTTNASVGARSLGIVGMDPVKGGLTPEVTSGRLPQGPEEIDLGILTARTLRARVGGEITVNGASGARRLRVTGIVLVPPVGGVDSVGGAALVTGAGMVAIDPAATMSAVGVALAPGHKAGAAGRIAALTGWTAGQLDPPSAIVNLHRVRTIPFVVAAAVGLLALLSLGHLMVVAVRRRRRDVAVLRALGATRRWLGGVVYRQATMTIAAVLVVAVPVGIALGRLVYATFVRHVGARTDVVVPLRWFAVVAVALVVLANVVAAASARTANRLSPAAILARD